MVDFCFGINQNNLKIESVECEQLLTFLEEYEGGADPDANKESDAEAVQSATTGEAA